MVKTLSALNKRFELTNRTADSHGQVESLTLLAPDDFAGLDICYTEGDEVLEQTVSLVGELKKMGAETPPPVPWEEIKRYGGRFDVLHFEQIAEEVADEPDEEMLDPSALLIVLAALAKLTKGVAVDPQAGTFLTEE